MIILSSTDTNLEVLILFPILHSTVVKEKVIFVASFQTEQVGDFEDKTKWKEKALFKYAGLILKNLNGFIVDSDFETLVELDVCIDISLYKRKTISGT